MVGNVVDTVSAVQSGSWTVTALASTGFAALATQGSAVPGDGYLVFGSDGTNARAIKTDNTGIVQVAITSGSSSGVEGTISHDGAWGTLKPIGIGAYANATAPTAVSADGDMVHLWADLNGRLAVWDGASTISIDDGTGSITVDGTVSVTGVLAAATLGDDTTNPSVGGLAAFSMVFDGTTWDRMRGTSAGGVYVQGPQAHDAAIANNQPQLMGAYAKDTTAPTSVSADGDLVQLWADRSGRLAVWDGASTISIDDGTGSITVDGSVSITGSVTVTDGSGSLTVDGTVIVTGGVAHDAVYSGSPVLLGGYASASAPTDVSADGDVVRLWLDRAGRTIIGDGGGSISIDDNSSSITVDGTGLGVVGGAAHDAAVSGNPLLLGAYASAAAPSAVSADGDAVRLWSSLTGQLHTITTGETVSSFNSQKTVTVDTTGPDQILAAYSSRKGFVIINQGTTDVYIGNGSVVSGASGGTANGGILLKRGGGSFTSTQMYGYTGAIHGITASSSTVIGVIEW